MFLTPRQLRMILGALLAVAGFIMSCAHDHAQDTVVGPQLGESTALGPNNPSAPSPDAAGATETHSGLIVGMVVGTSTSASAPASALATDQQPGQPVTVPVAPAVEPVATDAGVAPMPPARDGGVPPPGAPDAAVPMDAAGPMADARVPR
jgi:hypothetical protein